MTRVISALIPIALFAIWLYGWRVLLTWAVVTVFGAAAEYLMARLVQGDKAKVTEACFVSCLLYSLILPPALPLWIAVVGIVFAMVFAKGAFGGFGRNIFNPALVARCFIYVTFPSYMTAHWSQPFGGFPGGFAKFSAAPDMMTTATPLIELKTGTALPALKDLFLGVYPGSAGESAVILILLAAVYLLATKTASWRIMLSGLVGAVIPTVILYLAGVSTASPLSLVLSGGFLFGLVFMATDPVTAPRDKTAQLIFGAGVGVICVIIRQFSLFAEGMMFAILIGNAFVPLIERHVKTYKEKAAKRKAAAETA